ncbi:MAG: LysR family transcriptional regulator [Ideonella sp.]|nr:LysR family transcriptional regulator [Ideonella sp.]MCC7455595.1 LysR family transcriptional regulator [Nitrospira sp.]
MRIDPRRLLDLLAIARHGTISAAAQALNVSQPGLSQSVTQLEHGLGVKVLERDRHGARLTEFGRVLVFHARALDALLSRAKEETRLHALGIEGPLAVGITPVSAVSLVPQALALLLEEAPKVAVSLVEGLDDDLVAMLHARELDMVVSRLRPGLHGVASEPLTSSGWALITHPKHPLAQRKSVQLAEIPEERWVLPAGGSAFRRQMEIVFEAAGLPWPTAGISTNSILAIKAIVMNTEGVTIMSPVLVDVERKAGRLQVVPLQEVSPLQPVGMLWRSDDEPSRAAARFAKFLRLVAARTSEP